MRKFFGVGINNYPGAPLSGCVNDERGNEAKIASPRYNNRDGWQGRRKLNATATKRAIIEGLKFTCQGARSRDNLALTLSGHGTEQVSQGKLQHAFCAVDFCFDEEHTLWAREVAEILGNLPSGVRTLIMWDSCHSEWTKNDRNPMGLLANGTRRGISPRSYPLDNQPDIRDENEVARFNGNDGGNPLMRAIENGTIPCCYIAGCGAAQTSADVQDSTGAYGAATHYFWQAADSVPMTTPMIEVVKKANELLRADQFEQVMQCEGAQAGMSLAEIFGV